MAQGCSEAGAPVPPLISLRRRHRAEGPQMITSKAEAEAEAAETPRRDTLQMASKEKEMIMWKQWPREYVFNIDQQIPQACKEKHLFLADRLNIGIGSTEMQFDKSCPVTILIIHIKPDFVNLVHNQNRLS